MLRHLQIRDFAIIEAVELELSPGLTVLTGETGAGKSILIDALELLCGGKAGAELVRAGAERADVTATVDISKTGGALRHLLDDQSISADGELMIRRVVGTDGRSRAWVNGQAIPLPLLRQVTELLFDIHGQHEFQSLVRPATQRTLVDSFGRHESLVTKVRAAHSTWLALLNRSIELDSAANESAARLELLRHQLAEIETLQIKPGEAAELREERNRVANRGRLSEAVLSAFESLYDSDTPNAHASLAKAMNALQQAGAMDPQLAPLHALLDEANIRVKEASRTLQRYLDALESDPQRGSAIEQRLSAMEDLARKHRIAPDALADKQTELAEQLRGIEHASADLTTIRTQLAAATASYHEFAKQLSARRATAARALAKEISGHMQELGMNGGRFLIDVLPAESNEPAAHGLDQILFRVSTNPGQPPRAIAKVASGGELSRLSLSVQVSCAQSVSGCMVFDEVDSGIGGAVAEIVGRELRELGEHGQVLCVTHLPQVAAQGHQHLRVAKRSDGKHTRTSVTPLTRDESVDELARMLGGVEVSARARAHAQEMLTKVGSRKRRSG